MILGGAGRPRRESSEPADTPVWPSWLTAVVVPPTERACLDCGAPAGKDCADQCPSAIAAELEAEANYEPTEWGAA